MSSQNSAFYQSVQVLVNGHLVHVKSKPEECHTLNVTGTLHRDAQLQSTSHQSASFSHARRRGHQRRTLRQYSSYSVPNFPRSVGSS